jgi:hypothetical protein
MKFIKKLRPEPTPITVATVPVGVPYRYINPSPSCNQVRMVVINGQGDRQVLNLETNELYSVSGSLNVRNEPVQILQGAFVEE